MGELDTYRDMNFGQSKDEVYKKPKEALEDKKLEKNERAMQTRESKSDKGYPRKNAIQSNYDPQFSAKMYFKFFDLFMFISRKPIASIYIF